METCLREVRGATVSVNVPFKLVSDVERAFEVGTIKSCTPDVKPLLPQLKLRALQGKPLRYSEASTGSRLTSLQLILLLFFARQRGTAATFVPRKHVGRYFLYIPTLDARVAVEDLRTLFSTLKRIEVNSAWWKPVGPPRVKTKSVIVIDFKRKANYRESARGAQWG